MAKQVHNTEREDEAHLLLMLYRSRIGLGEGNHRVDGLEVHQAWATTPQALCVQPHWVLGPCEVPYGATELVSHRPCFRLALWNCIMENP